MSLWMLNDRIWSTYIKRRAMQVLIYQKSSQLWITATNGCATCSISPSDAGSLPATTCTSHKWGVTGQFLTKKQIGTFLVFFPNHVWGNNLQWLAMAHLLDMGWNHHFDTGRLRKATRFNLVSNPHTQYTDTYTYYMLLLSWYEMYKYVIYKQMYVCIYIYMYIYTYTIGYTCMYIYIYI